MAQRPLAQPSRHFGPVRLLSLWRGANFAIARATGLRLFCHFVIVCHQDTAASHSQAGAESSHASQPMRHQDTTLDCCHRAHAMCKGLEMNKAIKPYLFKSLSVWRGDHLIIKKILCRDLGKPIFSRELAQRPCHRDPLKRSCTEFLPSGLSQRSC